MGTIIVVQARAVMKVRVKRSRWILRDAYEVKLNLTG